MNTQEWANRKQLYSIEFDVNNANPNNKDGMNYFYVDEDLFYLYLAYDLCSDQTNDTASEWCGVWLNTNQSRSSSDSEWLSKRNCGFESLIFDVNHTQTMPYFSNDVVWNPISLTSEDQYDLVSGQSVDDWHQLQSLEFDEYAMNANPNGTGFFNRIDFTFNVTALYPQLTSDYLDHIQYFQILTRLNQSRSISECGLTLWGMEYNVDIRNVSQTIALTTGTAYSETTTQQIRPTNMTSDGIIRFSIWANDSTDFITNLDCVQFQPYVNQTSLQGSEIQYPISTIQDYQLAWSFSPSVNNASNHRIFEIRIPKSELEGYSSSTPLGMIMGGYGTMSFPNSLYWAYPTYTQVNDFREMISLYYQNLTLPYKTDLKYCPGSLMLSSDAGTPDLNGKCFCD